MRPMDPEGPVAAVILAAGAGTRYGGRKALAPFDGGTLLDAVVRAAAGAGLAPVIVVAPTALALPAGAVRVVNDSPAAGLSRSLRVGVDAVPPAATATVVMLADQPTVASSHLRGLLRARGSRPIVATEAGGIVGAPVLLERAAFAFVERTSGDAGLRDLLRTIPDLVTPVVVPRALPDVDRPDDLSALAERCPGCGERYRAATPAAGRHPYVGASPGCWTAFGELLAREFGNPAYGRVHRHTADAYAVQHPGTDGRRERQSVAVHLVGLCHWLERGVEGDRLNSVTRRLADSGRDWPWLASPSDYEITVLDVLTARTGEEHVALVRRWAETTWAAWGAHHDLVRRWADEALD